MQRLRSHPEVLAVVVVVAFVVTTMVDSYRRSAAPEAALIAPAGAQYAPDRGARALRPAPGKAATFSIGTGEGGFWFVGGERRRATSAALDVAVGAALTYGAGAWPGGDEVFVHTPRGAERTRVRVVLLDAPQGRVRRRGADVITDVDLDARGGTVLARSNGAGAAPVALRLPPSRYRARVTRRAGSVRVALWRARAERAPVVHVRRR